MTFMLTVLGLLGVMAIFLYAPDVARKIREKLEDNRIKKWLRLICFSVALILIIGIVIIPPMRSCRKLNSDLNDFLKKPVGESTLDAIHNFDTLIAEEGFWGKLYIKHTDEFEAKRQETYQFIDGIAAELSAAIDQLEVYESLQSKEQINEVRNSISALHKEFNTNGDIYHNDDYYAELQARTSNYNDLLTYEADFEALVSSYATECTQCDGNGRIVRSCSSCDGKGKKLVTWYSQGDWGSTSYSNYECTNCGGDGKTISSCTSCTDGYFYDFDD